jgi:hypothetical protein
VLVLAHPAPGRIATAAALALLLSLPTSSVGAQRVPKSDLSPDEAHTLFVRAGYQVDPLRTWDWLSPPVSTFEVRDAERNRLLLVAVYPDVAQAQRGSVRMVEGYSASTWIDNLALFEADADAYQRTMADALARDLGMQVDLPPQSAADPSQDQQVDQAYTALVIAAQDTADPIR